MSSCKIIMDHGYMAYVMIEVWELGIWMQELVIEISGVCFYDRVKFGEI